MAVVEPKFPSYATGEEVDSLVFELTVYYTDGTSTKYQTEGNFNSMEALDCPGTLTFIEERTSSSPSPPGYPGGPRLHSYYYEYTESGVTTGAFVLCHFVES